MLYASVIMIIQSNTVFHTYGHCDVTRIDHALHLTSVRVRTDCYMLTGSDSCCCFELLCSPLTLSSFLLVSCVFCPPLALILKIWAGKDHLVQCDSCKTLVLLVRYSSFQGVQFSFFSLMKDNDLCYNDIRDIVSSIIAF